MECEFCYDQIYLPIQGHSEGDFEFVSLEYRFHNLLPITESLSVPTRTTAGSSSSSPVRLPTVSLRPPIPILTVKSDQLPSKLFHGQFVTGRLKVRNDGQVGLKRLRGISDQPEITLFSSSSPSNATTMMKKEEDTFRLVVGNEIRENESVELIEQLGPGEEREIEVMVRGNEVGTKEVKWLFAYESTVSPD